MHRKCLLFFFLKKMVGALSFIKKKRDHIQYKRNKILKPGTNPVPKATNRTKTTDTKLTPTPETDRNKEQ
jgi:hypothetical protein